MPRILNIDAVALTLIIFGGIFLYQQNTIGWFFIILGILKDVLDRDRR